MQKCVELGYCKSGDSIVVLTGRVDEDFEGRDIIKTMTVPDFPMNNTNNANNTNNNIGNT